MRALIASIALAVLGCTPEVVELLPRDAAAARDVEVFDASSEDARSTDPDATTADAEALDLGFEDAMVTDRGFTPDTGVACVCRLLRCRLAADCLVIDRTSSCNANGCTGAAPGSCTSNAECGAGQTCTQGPGSTTPC